MVPSLSSSTWKSSFRAAAVCLLSITPFFSISVHSKDLPVRPYLSRIPSDHNLTESMFAFPAYISPRDHPVIWPPHSDQQEQAKKSTHDDVVQLEDEQEVKVTTHGLLTDDELRFYEENGYISLSDFITNDQLQTYQDRLSDLLQNIDEKTCNTSDYYVVYEPNSQRAIKSVFQTHRDLFYDLASNERLIGIVQQILGSFVYVHQGRINLQSESAGQGFQWHSDFETWHTEDGMPTPRALSVVVLLDDGYEWNGALMAIPGSHKYFVHTFNPDGNSHGVKKKNWESSLRQQYYGTPSRKQLEFLVDTAERDHGVGIEYIGKGKKGDVLLFDSNLMHGSHSNISPKSRETIFMVYNSLQNVLGEPVVGYGRPNYLAERQKEWIRPIQQCRE